jgi:hypothetical protein
LNQVDIKVEVLTDRKFSFFFNVLSKSSHKVVFSWKFEPRAKKWVYTNIRASLWAFDNVNNWQKRNPTKTLVGLWSWFWQFLLTFLTVRCLVDRPHECLANSWLFLAAKKSEKVRFWPRTAFNLQIFNGKSL